jgi:hypothetical protein
MTTKQRIRQLENTNSKTQNNYLHWLEVEDTLAGMARDIRKEAAQSGEPEPESESLKAMILQRIAGVKNEQ